MSRAFVKEDNGDQPEQLPERPISKQPNYMTRAGYAAMAAELQALQAQLLQLKDSEDMDSRSRQALLQRDIRYFGIRLQSAIVVEPAAAAPQTVIFGCRVSFVDEEGREYHYRIVGEDEADVEQHRISWCAPLAKALLGKQVGDLVLWQKPAGSREVEITAIAA